MKMAALILNKNFNFNFILQTNFGVDSVCFVDQDAFLGPRTGVCMCVCACVCVCVCV